jgi:quinol monooxygenase YgiN
VIIVSGKIYVEPADRESYLAGCRELIELARTTKGCLDFHLSADPIEHDRINVYEQWSTVADVETFRGSGPPSDQAARIRDAQVVQHEVTSSEQL